MSHGPSPRDLDHIERTLHAQRAQQDDAIAQMSASLAALGDVELAIPNDFLEELSTLTEPHATRTSAMPMIGIRG